MEPFLAPNGIGTMLLPVTGGLMFCRDTVETEAFSHAYFYNE